MLFTILPEAAQDATVPVHVLVITVPYKTGPAIAGQEITPAVFVPPVAVPNVNSDGIGSEIIISYAESISECNETIL